MGSGAKNRMSGIFKKMKEKKAEIDKRAEEAKVGDILRQIDSRFKDFKKYFENQLGKKGLSFSYLALSGADARQRNPGAIIGRFNDTEGYPITLVQSLQLYEGTPWGATFSKRIVYVGPTIWGTIVQGSIPFTLLFKEVDKGFMKGKARLFLPLTAMPFNEKELLLDPRLQEPVVATLNADKKLVDSVNDKLALATSIYLTHKSSMTISCADIGGKCVIIPAEDETAIFLRTYRYGYGEPKIMLEILSTIRKHILAHPYAEKVSGKVPAAIFNTMYALCKAKSPEPSKDSVS